MLLFSLLVACVDPECPEGQKFNLDGLCVEDTSKPETEDSPPPEDSEPVDDSEPIESGADDSEESQPVQTDWEVLGGETAVTALVGAFVSNVGADAEINWMFANGDLGNLQTRLVELVSSATGGPLSYGGQDMVSAHAGMAITDAQWTALLRDFVGALDQTSVPYTADFSGDYPADRLVVALVGMHDDIVTDAQGDTVLFNELGGYGGTQALIGEFLTQVGADARINGFFASTDLTNLQRLLVEQVCEATGGYCVYSGRSMAATHAGMGVSEDDFNAMVEDLLLAMDELNIAYTPGTFDGGLPADQLILALAAMAPDIIEP